ncbi:MAG: preprotein translocase subunit SecE [Acidobacteriota bacterium]|nr:MAG: preprotein translocase subunit SecE [Acidobacteriota bacterium]
MSFLEKVVGLPQRLSTFAADVKSELKKVTWPSKKEIYGTTIVVIVTVFFFGVYLFVVDSGLQVVIKRVFNMFL